MDKKDIIDFFKDLIFIVVVVVVIKTFIAMPFQINGQSMYSSYYDKEFIIVDRLTYSFVEPKRWDVIVFKPYISDERKYFLKRIIGIPWDNIKIENWKIYLKKNGEINYKELDEKYLNPENKWFTFVWGSSEMHEYSIWEWQYYVLWDNRNHSTDARDCFSSCAIIGRSFFINKSDITWKLFLDLGYFNIKTFSFIQPELWIDTKPKFFNSPSSFEY